MRVKGWVRSSLLDYPERIAASLFCGGCNFRCPNCHNGPLVARPNDYADIDADEIWSFLEKRVGRLDGVVISGGEPTLQPDLADFCAQVQEMGFLVKLDTNGYRPDVLAALIDAGVVDYVAMDVKAPLGKYSLAAGVEVDVARIESSIACLLEGRVAYEFRTTVVPGILFEQDVDELARVIAGARQYYLQQFVPRDTLDPRMLDVLPYTVERVRHMADLARQHVTQVGLRGL